MKKRTSILSEIMQVEKEMEMIIEGFFELASPFQAIWRPNLDIYENEKEFILEVELPGVNKEDIKLSISNDRLQIRGIKRGESCSEPNFRFILMEREYGYFQRSIPLPGLFDPSNSKAILKNGILTITLPKISEYGERISFEILIE
ncbi:MAG: Hsp20/alpha crystallin family protein [Candidatus Aminicenantia bacterium]